MLIDFDWIHWDSDWYYLRFHGQPNLFGFDDSKDGRVSRDALRHLLAHVANRRELCCILTNEAKQFRKENPKTELITIEMPLKKFASGSAPALLNVNTLEETIDTLERFDLAKTDFKEVVALVDKMLHGAGTIVTRPIFGAAYHRVRKRPLQHPNWRPSMLKDVDAPAARFVTNFQRCNGPGSPMFYCSDNWDIALRETRVQPGDVAYLSTWVVKGPMVTFSMPPGRCDGQDRKSFDILSTYINRKFTEEIDGAEDSRYMITAAFAHLYATGRLDRFNPRLEPLAGIYYRSVVNRNAENLAIFPSQVRANMELSTVYELIIGDCSGELPEVDVTAVATPIAQKGVAWGRQVLKWQRASDDPALAYHTREWLNQQRPNTNLDYELEHFPDLFDVAD
jgi:hypothetical protein